MIIHEIHDLSNTHVIDLMMREYSNILDENFKNYHPDYMNNSGNIFKILKDGRYKKGHGKYYVIEEDNKLISSAGWNEYELEPTIALLLTRMYTTPSKRGNYFIGNNLLPKAIEEAKNYKKLWMTVNEHNKIIYKWFERSHQGKRTALFNDWPEIYKKFTPIGEKNIYYTQQFVVEYTRSENV